MPPARAPLSLLGTRASREAGGIGACAALLAVLAGCRSGAVFDKETPWKTPRHGAVVTEHPLATQVGLAILDKGGNAADAAVAAALVLAVVYPQAGNLGGGGFALWVPHSGEARAIDFREIAPQAASAERYLGPDGKRVDQRSLAGPLAVGVPGTPLGLYEIFKTCGSGKLRFQDLVRPAVDFAQRGFEVDPWLARDLSASGRREQFNAAARDLFYPRGEPLRAGDLLRQPDLALTLSLYLNEGPSAFYSGRVGQAILRELDVAPIPGSNGTGKGWITPADLSGYKVKTRKPLTGWFRGMEIVTMPLPSSGGIALLQTLGVLEGLPLDAERTSAIAARAIQKDKGKRSIDCEGLSERMVHWWIEALRMAFADRADHMGDPEFVPDRTADLLSSSWIAARRVSIGENADASLHAWEPPREGQSTTHLSVLDQNGNALSLTTTLNDTFGSGILVRGGGFLLNNEIDDFSITPGSPNLFGLVGGSANAIAPSKRPLSSMTPTVVRDGGHANVIVLGSPGGPRIISAVLQVLLRRLVLEQSPSDAVAAPRLHQQWSPPATSFEPGFDPEIIGALENRRGHRVTIADGRFASVQAIFLREPGAEPVAVSDPRRGGASGVQGQPISKPTRPPVKRAPDAAGEVPRPPP